MTTTMASLKNRFDQASARRDISTLKDLFREMPDIHALSEQTGLTPAQLFPWATLASNAASMQACLHAGASITPEVEKNAHTACNLDVYRVLVPAGLDINKHFGYGGTALTEAITTHDEEFVKFLLDSGADPNIGSLNGSSALEVAVKESVPVSSIKSIIDHGAEFPTKGLLSLAVLAGDADTVEFLLKNGANVNETTENTFETNLRGKELSVTHLAVMEGHIDVAKVLTEYGANTMARDANGMTAFDIAIESNRAEIAELLKRAAFGSML